MVAISKVEKQGEAKRIQPWSSINDSHFSHFWSTSWSSIYTCYMSFRSSGSQQSNALNSVWFGVEMKELQPLETDHSKLKEEFSTALRNHLFVAKWFCILFVQCCGFSPEVSRHNGSRIPQAESQLRSAAKSAFCCEVISQPFCTVQWNFSWSFSIFATDTFGYFASDFWCLNPHFLLVTHQL